MVGLFISPTAGEEILTHLVCVSLVSLLEETVSKMFLFKIGQYDLAPVNSPEKEAYK